MYAGETWGPKALTTYDAALGPYGTDKFHDNSTTTTAGTSLNIRQLDDYCPLYIRGATTNIITKNIGQSSPYPCDVNTISITLSTSLPMISRPELSQCTPCITIEGLKGAQNAAASIA